jgi:mannosyltransferase
MTIAASMPRIRSARAPEWLAGPLVPAAVAAVLGVIGIGDKSLWQDEAFSAAVARLPTIDVFTYLFHNELHASPHYVLLHVWSALGTGEAQLRLLSVVVGVIAVVATYYVGARYGVGFLAALLVALSPIFIQFEQNVREYTMVVAWASISTLAYLRYRELPTRLRAVLYVLAGALMIYVHPVGAFLVSAHFLWDIWHAPAARRLRAVAVYVPIAIAWLPMIRFMVFHRDKISWIPPLSDATVSEAALALGGGALGLGALAVLLVLRSRRDLITLWLVLPIAGVLVVSAFVQPMLQARYLIVVLPAAAIIAARNHLTAVLLLSALWLAGVATWYMSPAPEDWRAADAWLQAASQPGDGIVFWPSYTRLPIEYYGAVDEPIFPAMPWSATALPGLVPQTPISPNLPNPRVWLVQRHAPALTDDLVAALAPYTASEVRTYGSNDVTVTLLVRGGGS